MLVRTLSLGQHAGCPFGDFDIVSERAEVLDGNALRGQFCHSCLVGSPSFLRALAMRVFDYP